MGKYKEGDVIAMMVTIKKYWETADGEPELREFAEYLLSILDEKVAQATKKAEVETDWWITTDFFRLGGKKVLGPFQTKELALEVRRLLEGQKKMGTIANTYAIDRLQSGGEGWLLQ